MIIGMVSREYPPFFGGGVGSYVFQMSRAFALAGYEVHVFTVRTGQDDKTYDPPGVNVHRMPFNPPAPSESGFDGQWVAANSWFHAAQLFQDALVDFVKGHPLDIVEFPEWEAPGWPLLLDEGWTVPSVVNCHTPTWFLQQLNEQPPLGGQNMEFLQLALADGVCAPCGPMAKVVNESLKLLKKPQVVYHPYFADDFAGKILQPKDGKMLYVGRLEHRKGVVTLIKAANRVLTRFGNAQLFCIGGDTNTAPGGGSMREHLESLIQPQIADRIRFIDNIPASQLREKYQDSMFCVFPSIFENFPNVCLEAMSSARTSVVSANSGMVEMLDGAGIVVEPETPDALAEAMCSLLGDAQKTAALGQKARQRVQKRFAPERIAKERLAYYRSVIESAGAKTSLQKRLARVDKSVWDKAGVELSQALGLCLGRKNVADEQSRKIADRVVSAIQKAFPDQAASLQIALYGAGQHTQKLLPQLDYLLRKGIEIVLIVDDNPDSHGRQIKGIDVAAPQMALDEKIDAIVLSSDSMEKLLWEKTEILRNKGKKVLRLYPH